MELRPDSHQAECLLGDIYGTMKDLKAAEEHYLKAAQLAPQYASVYKARLAALSAPVKRRPAARKRS